MFRLVYFREDDPNEAEIVRYLSPIVTKTILDAFAYLFKSEDDYRSAYQILSRNNFFRDFGQYYLTSDDTAGYELYRRKLERMQEKLRDPDEYYTFDVLEERIFCFCIAEMEARYERGAKDFAFINLKQEEEVTVTLVNRFELEAETAEKLALTACRFHEMNLTEDDDDNLVFWDDDYLWFFRDGFVAGIKILLDAAGEQAGYGYNYVEKIFTDVDLKPPMMLIGTADAHRIANDQTMERFREAVNQMFSVSPEEEARWEKERQELADQLGISVEELDEELPFS